MATINDYLLWRGDLRFSERPFNDVDNLVLSALAYLDFGGIVPGLDDAAGSDIALADACREVLNRAQGDIGPYVRSFAKIDATFVERLASSRRFGDARLSACVDLADPERALQFSALCVHLGDGGGTYVAYRGTDSTLVGWRENFHLSFTVTEAQKEAALYAERVISTLAPTARPIILGGHSKGGNLAEYAAACCSLPMRSSIDFVYSNDGPGMAPEVVPFDTREALAHRLRCVVPDYSVVGMLFAREDDPRIVVRSSALGIEEHDLTTWQVGPTGLEEAPKLKPDCMVLNRAIAAWAADVPLDERERVVDEVFDALEASGATRFAQILSSPDSLQRVMRALAEVDDRTRDVAMALVQHALDSSIDAVRATALGFVAGTGRRLLRSARAE